MRMKMLWRLAFPLALAFAVVFTAGCSRNPNVLKQKYFASGTAYFQKQKYKEAAIQFANAAKVDPKFAEAHYQLAQCYIRLELWSGAYQELSRTIDLQPDNLKAQFELGNLLFLNGQFELAASSAQTILEKDPSSADGHLLAANAAAGLKEMPTALKEMQKAIRLAPDRSDLYVNMAFLQIKANDNASAEDTFKKAISADPKSVTSVLALADFYRSQRRWPQAEQQFHQAVELEPKNLGARGALAAVYIAEGRKPEAEQLMVETKKLLSGDPEGYRSLGDFYFNAGDQDKALAEYESLYRSHPKDPRVKKNYVQLLILQNRLADAAKLNGEILKGNANDADALLYEAQMLGRQGHTNDAVPLLQKIIKNAPENATAHYYLGLAYDQLGNSGQAESEWRNAVRLNPNFTSAQQALATTALRNGDYGQLAASAEQIITDQPSSAQGYILRATARISQKDQTGAEADLRKAIELAPRDPTAFSRLAGLRSMQGRYADAEKLLDSALAMNPHDQEPLQGLIGLYFRQKQPAKALARVDEQIAKDPGNSNYYFLRGVLLINAKNMDQGQAALEKAVSLDQNNQNALLLLGQVLVARGQADQAIVKYQQAIQEKPTDVRPYVLLAIIENAQGSWQKAEELYQKALQVQPEFPMAANNLAYLMLEHGGNKDVALSLAQKARQKMSDSPDAADTVAWAYYHEGSYGLAIGLLQEALKQVPNNASFHYHLGLAYEKTDDRVHAKEHLERVLQIDPKFPHADDVRQALLALSAP